MARGIKVVCSLCQQEVADPATAIDILRELQEQEKRYRNCAMGYYGESMQEGEEDHTEYNLKESAYYRGKADGIREALKAYGERGVK